MAEAQKTLRVTQIKSSIGYKKDQLATLKSLGLGKIGRSHDLVDNESVRGMIFKVKHLVKVEELLVGFCPAHIFSLRYNLGLARRTPVAPIWALLGS